MLKKVKSNKRISASYTENYLNYLYIICSFAYQVVCVDGTFSRSVIVYRGKNAAYFFIKYDSWIVQLL